MVKDVLISKHYAACKHHAMTEKEIKFLKKEGERTTNMLPYKALSAVGAMRLVYFVVLCLNSFSKQSDSHMVKNGFVSTFSTS